MFNLKDLQSLQSKVNLISQSAAWKIKGCKKISCADGSQQKALWIMEIKLKSTNSAWTIISSPPLTNTYSSNSDLSIETVFVSFFTVLVPDTVCSPPCPRGIPQPEASSRRSRTWPGFSSKPPARSVGSSRQVLKEDGIKMSFEVFSIFNRKCVTKSLLLVRIVWEA